MKIHIIDSPCGTGKTEYAIKYMNKKSDKTNFMYITPFLKEVQRIKQSVNFDMKEPKDNNKYLNLIKLVSDSTNIVSTHSLFSMGDEELADLIMFNQYELILDEVLGVLEPLGFKRGDVDLLLRDEIIAKDENNIVYLTTKGDELLYSKGTKFKDQLDIIKSGRVIMVKGGLMLWQFPIDMLQCFKKVIILTYMFENQTMHNYLKANGEEFVYHKLENYELKDGRCDYTGTRYKDLINIYQGKLNNPGEQDTSLSMTWYAKASNRQKINVLARNSYNFLRNIIKTNSDKSLWTCPKEYYDNNKCIVRDHKSSFVPMTSRATNDYSHKNTLCYLVNRYENPSLHHYFVKHGIAVNNSMFALSEMIQWIFRSALRKDEPIDIYIPSQRMRELLESWIDGEFEAKYGREISEIEIEEDEE